MAKKKRGPNKANIEAANQVIAHLLDRRIIAIHTQSALYRMIEIAKWPHTANFTTEKVTLWPGHTYRRAIQRKPGEPLHWRHSVYAGKQYRNVLEFLCEKVFDVSYAKGKYRYTFNHTKARTYLRELQAKLA